MSTTIKFPKPHTFDGSRDGFIVLSWLNALHRYFDGTDIPDNKKTVYAISYLTGGAGLWWEGKGFGHKIPFDTFEREIISEYIPHDFMDHVSNLLVAIKMESTVTEYVARIRQYMNILCSADMHIAAREQLNKTTRSAFLHGCPTELRTLLKGIEISSQSSANLDQILSAAEQYDQLYHFKPESTSSTSIPTNIHPVPKILNPDAMEIDSLKLQLNAMAIALNYQSQYLKKNVITFMP
ncbi:hypothetical protein BGZ58_003024 [Dissophora ornata]|nr:hypothetical protein BGZ58_003024 [Dissophora ornata]